MQGLFFVCALLLTIVCAQGNDQGGCCFYSSVDYDPSKVIACTNQPFRKEDQDNKEGIRSFHCTPTWAAEINDKKGSMEEANCGDEVGETTESMNYHNITIVECRPRRCCFYTQPDKTGDEYCLFTDDAPADELTLVQTNKFRYAECLDGWQATLFSTGKTDIGCGVGTEIEKPETFKKISVKACPKARAEIEAVENTFQGAEFDTAFVDTFDSQVDAAFVENSVDTFNGENLDATFVDSSVDAFQADAAFVENSVDTFNGDNLDATFVDSSVDDFQADAAFTDNSVDTFQGEVALGEDGLAFDSFDHTVDDNFDAAVLDTNEVAFVDSNEYFDQAAMDAFDQTFEDQQVLDNNEYYGDYATDVQQSSYSTGSAVMGSLLALVAVLVVVY